MSTRLKGRHVIVTGGGTGLGAAISAAVAQEAAAVTVMGRTQATLDAQAARLRKQPARVMAVACDVTSPESVARAFALAVRENGPVHVLVNNAGHATAERITDITLESWQQTIAVNLTGAFLCIQQTLPAMLKTGYGRIINVASTAGIQGFSRVTAYCAAKHGVVGLTRALAAETTRTGVTVNALCPGYVDGTPMLVQAIANITRATGQSAAAVRDRLAQASPGGVLATMQDVVNHVLRLCEDEAAAITGQAIIVTGGELPS